MRVRVYPFAALQSGRWDAVVTALPPNYEGNNLYRIRPYRGQIVLQLWMHDTITASNLGAPAMKHIEDLMGIMPTISERYGANVNIACACEMGISRSSALAYTILTAHYRDPEIAWDALRRDPRAKHFWPNILIVGLADEYLGMGGAMVKKLVSSKWE